MSNLSGNHKNRTSSGFSGGFPPVTIIGMNAVKTNVTATIRKLKSLKILGFEGSGFDSAPMDPDGTMLLLFLQYFTAK